MMPATEKVPIPKELLDIWLQETILYELGYMVVSNYGGSYAMVENGIYSVKKQGFTKQGTADKDEQIRIFTALIKRYLNFERNGYNYYYSRGSWIKDKVKERFTP